MKPMSFNKFIEPYIYEPATPYTPARYLPLTKEFESHLKEKYQNYLKNYGV